MPSLAACKLIILAAMVAAISAITSAAAAPKPLVSINTRAAEITVTIDAALGRHAGLAENLIAEGRRWANRQRAEAADVRRQSPEEFRNGRKYAFEREYEQRSVVGHYVSIVRTDYTDTGGAHPNSNIDTILWDSDARRRISIRPFLNDSTDNGAAMTAMAKLARLAVAREKIARGTTDEDDDKKKATPESVAQEDTFIADGVKPTLLGLGPVTLAPSTVPNKSSGLSFHYSPYAVGSYAEGPYIVFVPWTELKPFLSVEGLALFGGERPESDKKE
jgi:hypothetical protein